MARGRLALIRQDATPATAVKVGRALGRQRGLDFDTNPFAVTVFHEKGPPVKGRLVTPLRSRLSQIVIRALFQSSIRTLSGLR